MVPDGVQAPEPCFLSTYYVERTPDISSAPEGGLRGGQLGFKDCLRVPKLPSCPRALGWGGEPCCRWSRFHGDSFSVSRSRRAAITSMPPWTSQICSEQTLTPVPGLVWTQAQRGQETCFKPHSCRGGAGTGHQGREGAGCRRPRGPRFQSTMAAWGSGVNSLYP